MQTKKLVPLIALFSVIFASCSVAPGSPPQSNESLSSAALAPGARPHDKPDVRPPSLLDSLGAICTGSSPQQRCVIGNMDAGDFYEVETTQPCDSTGFFAGVVVKDAELIDTLPVTGSKPKVTAVLSQKQFVCVQVIARAGQKPFYYYVAALSPSSVPACKGKNICTSYGERPAKLQAQAATGVACTVDSAGVASGDCPSGWIAPDALDEFSNGLDASSP